MKDCAYYETLMSRLLDGDLTAAERDELFAHTADCPGCAKKIDALAIMTAALREDQAEPPAALARGVMARIAAEKKTAAPRRSAPVRPVGPWVRLAAAACLVIAIGVGAVNLRDSIRARETAEQAPGIPPPIAEEDDGALSIARIADEAADETASAPENGVMSISAGEAALPVVSAQTMPVLDSAGNQAGTIPPENAAAFTDMLVDGQALSDSGPEAWTLLYTVTVGDSAYCFGTDAGQTQLVWWQQGVGTVFLSRSSLSDLRALILTE